MHAQKYNRSLGQLLGNLPASFNAVEERHGHVQDRDVRPVKFRQGDGFPSVRRLGDHLESRVALEQETQALANDGVIVSQQNADGVHVVACRRSGTDFLRGRTMHTMAPLPGRDSTENAPPRLLTRSCMPNSPIPRSCCASKPLPSSWMASKIRLGSC